MSVVPAAGPEGRFEEAEMPTLRREITVVNKLGLHARPAAMLVQLTSRYKSDVTISKDDMTVNAKSIMGVMMLAAEQGSTLQLAGVGEDAAEALDALAELFARKFDEEE